MKLDILKQKLLTNSLFNLVGYLIPAIVGFPALGILSRHLSVDLFGLFSICMILVGYASIFDFGITRSIVRAIAANKNNCVKVEALFGTALLIVTSISICIAIVFYISSGKITDLLNVRDVHYTDVNYSLSLLSFCFVLVLVNQTMWAVYEGYEEFKDLSILRVSSSLLMIILPMILSFVESSLSSVVLGLLIGRILSFSITLKHFLKRFNLKFRVDFSLVEYFLNYGGWLTLSNFISPLIRYFDRFLVSFQLGSQLLAFYSAPNDLVNRLNVIPNAISKALFPILCDSNSDAKSHLRVSFILSVGSALIVVIPIYFFSEPILTLWLGEPYGVESSIYLKIFLVGYFFNSLAQIPYSRIQALGHSKLTAKLHFAEAFFYLIVLFYVTEHYSLVGAAVCWTSRMVFDCVILFIFSSRLQRINNV